MVFEPPLGLNKMASKNKKKEDEEMKEGKKARYKYRKVKVRGPSDKQLGIIKDSQSKMMQMIEKMHKDEKFGNI